MARAVNPVPMVAITMNIMVTIAMVMAGVTTMEAVVVAAVAAPPVRVIKMTVASIGDGLDNGSMDLANHKMNQLMKLLLHLFRNN